MSRQLEWEKVFTEKVIPPANWNWWKNPTNKNSLRLQSREFSTISKHFKFYKFITEEVLLPKTLLQMERVFTEPYYISNIKTIFIHSEQDAVMLALHANNLQKYLDNLTT